MQGCLERGYPQFRDLFFCRAFAREADEEEEGVQPARSNVGFAAGGLGLTGSSSSGSADDEVLMGSGNKLRLSALLAVHSVRIQKV